MKYFNSKLLTLLIMVLLSTLTSNAQKNNIFWSKITKEKVTQVEKVLRKSEPSKASFYQLDLDKLKLHLENAPLRGESNKLSNVIIEFPNADGELESFRIKEAPVMVPEMQVNHPELRTYIGQSVKNPLSIIRFSITPLGLHTITLSTNNGTQYIDPYTRNGENYMVYTKTDLPTINETFICDFEGKTNATESNSFNISTAKNANDGMMRTYRLALACTGEYGTYHGGTELLVKAAMTVTMNRVNAIYERDLSITMVMVENSSIIYFDGATDPYTNNSGGAMLGENQTEIDTKIGDSNYDIGHVFSTGGGGVAYLNSPCTGLKAGGVTGLPNPTGEPFDVDYVSHEMGHQFGAPHTFNGDTGSCGGGNRTASNAYEPGSGNTIMAYAGICAPQNVQSQSDAYFHQKSLQMIWDNITTGSSTCSTDSPTGNTAPIANAGLDYTIPISTPYKLTGSSTDLDGTGTHTYTWEQYDLGPSGVPTETTAAGPLVRAFEGTNNPTRNIPEFSDYLISNGSTNWEKLSSVNRLLNFALTVRDNDINGGQTDVDFMQVTVNSIVPFAVNDPAIWSQGANQTIEWEVGQTADVGTINCQNVNILLSTDGGVTFPTAIASNTPNDGSFEYTVPAISNTTTARILVEAADNIFYDVSSVFSISNVPDLFLNNVTLDEIGCNATTATFNFDYTAANGFSETTTFSTTGNPAGSTVSFSPTSLNTSGSVTMTISNLDATPQGDYSLTLTGTSTSITKNIGVDLPFYNDICASVANIAYDTSTTLVQFNTIDNASGKGIDDPITQSGYSDYTAISTDVNRDSGYSLTIQANTDGNYTTLTRVWIDWNQNCSFDDPGEEYDLGIANNVTDGATSNSPLSITIPSDAVLGNTIMRVSTKYDFAPTACENNADAEVEDYTINVMPTLSVEEFGFENFTVFPNPNKGEFTVKLNSTLSSDINVEVYDLRGRVIYKQRFKDTGDFNERINLNHVQSGMYLLNVSDGKRKSTKKIIVE